MRRGLSLLVVVVLTLTFLSACIGKSFEPDRSTIYVKKNGKIIGATIESFDKDYYDAEELEKYVDEHVEDYLSKHGKGSIKIEKFQVENQVANLYIKYKGYKDYAEFNNVKMFTGTVIQAMAAGYDFSDEFLKVENGKLGRSADKNEVTEDSKYKVVILNEKMDVKVDGTILYVSAKYTNINAKDTVSIKMPENYIDGEELALTYIIYK